MSTSTRLLNTKAISGWLPYVLPMALFMLLTSAEVAVPAPLYPLAYGAKIALVGVVLISLRKFFPEAAPNLTGLVIGVPLGIALMGAWVGIDHFTPHLSILGHRSALDPFARFRGTGFLCPFLAVRFAGLVLVVPAVEELFWRSFMLRWIICPDAFRDVALGAFEPLSFGAVVVLMALSHPEWLAAAVFSAVMNLLLYRTRNLFACIATHAVTNLALGIFVLVTHAWRFW